MVAFESSSWQIVVDIDRADSIIGTRHVDGNNLLAVNIYRLNVVVQKIDIHFLTSASIQYYSTVFGNLLEVFSIFFSLLATLRSTFFMSSAGGRFSGFIPHCPSICLMLRFTVKCDHFRDVTKMTICIDIQQFAYFIRYRYMLVHFLNIYIFRFIFLSPH